VIDKDVNVADILRDIAAEAPPLYGEIVKLAEKAARKGKSFIDFEIEEWVYDQLSAIHNAKDWNYSTKDLPVPPFIEKLESTGFKYSYYSKPSAWSGTICFYLKITF